MTKKTSYPDIKKTIKMTAEDLKIKNRKRALKAWETIRKRKKYSSHEKDYNTEKKNLFRLKVINSFKDETKNRSNEKGLCLCLESPDLLFVDNLDKDFIIIEHNHKQYKMICEKLPNKRVKEIYYNDISLIRCLDHNYDYAFLDFCQTFNKMGITLKYIRREISTCFKIALTFCLRGNKKSMEDYKFDLISKLNILFPNFSLEYALAYRDGSPMIGLILYNNNHDKPLDFGLDEIVRWCQDECRKKYNHELYEYGNPVVNIRAKRFKVQNIEKCRYLFDNLPKKYLTHISSMSDVYCSYRGHNYNYDNKNCFTLFEWFIEVICRGDLQ